MRLGVIYSTADPLKLMKLLLNMCHIEHPIEYGNEGLAIHLQTIFTSLDLAGWHYQHR